MRLDPDVQRSRLGAVLRDHLDGDLAGWLERQASWAYRVTGEHADGPVRVGGLPVMPAGTPWPSSQGRNLSLVAVVDVAAMRQHGLRLALPEVEVVNLFYDFGDPLGEQSGFVPAHAVVAAAAHDGLVAPLGRSAPQFEPRTYQVRPVLTLPQFDEPIVLGLPGFNAVDDPWSDELVAPLIAATDEWSDLVADERDQPLGQIAGWPSLLQNPVLQECESRAVADEQATASVLSAAAPDWRQVAQFDASLIDWQTLPDVRMHFCFDSSVPAYGRTCVHWQAD